MDFNTPPIFLVGAERSGTTLLRLMLSHHPKISFANESEYLVDFISEDGEFPDIEKFCRDIQQVRNFPFQKVELIPTLSYQELATHILMQTKQKPDSPFIGATVHRNFHHLKKLWPQSRFIHIIRDPRDVSSSRIKRGWEHTHWHAIKVWISVEQLWEQLSSELSEGEFIELHYEDLISEPEKTLNRLCCWIGVDYDPAMFSYVENSTYSRPNSEFVQGWKKKLSDDEIQLIESECHDLLEKRNYQLSGLPIKQIGAVERFALEFENKYKKTLFRINKYGLSLYLQSVLAKRIPYDNLKQSVLHKIWEVNKKHIK